MIFINKRVEESIPFTSQTDQFCFKYFRIKLRDRNAVKKFSDVFSYL